MPCLTPAEFHARLRHFTTIAPPSVLLESRRSTAPVVELDHYRQQMADRRVESVGKPGIFLDQSPTGAGKSHADLAAFRVAQRSLSIQPTHENCEEVVQEVIANGLEAVAYPGRFTKTSKKGSQNCWNPDADAAESMSLSVAAAICPLCPEKKRCLEVGYLNAVQKAKASRVAVGTHARAIHTGLAELSDGIDFVPVHEDVISVLLPQISIPAESLNVARQVLHMVLNDPRWLDRFDTVWMVNSDGATTIKDEPRTSRRDAQYEFLMHMASVCDDLIATAAAAQFSQSVKSAMSQPEPVGIHSLLFHASREFGANFCGKPVWSVLLLAATGSYLRLGVITDDSNSTRHSNERTAR